jgi:transposase-like protein
MRTRISHYHRHRFPVEIISHSVWLFFRFALSFRDVEEILARDIMKSRFALWEVAIGNGTDAS